MTTHDTLAALWDSPVEKRIESSPFILEFFMVQGAGFRCMAYRDPNGVWRNAFNNEELMGEIYILE